ncbi:hypothetical protein ACF8O8_17460 [Pseudomonas sp. TYF_14]|uniref:hypothetical protein n=1 Tax=Pseudomonas sp. TYF_14 TaxID=3367193 RepID=UPI00370A5B94
MCIISAALLLLLVAYQGRLTLAQALALVFLLNCVLGVTGPLALTKCLNVNPRLTGAAAGVYGFLQMAAGAISTSLASVGSDPAISSVAVLLGAVASAQVSFWFSLLQDRKSAKAIPL